MREVITRIHTRNRLSRSSLKLASLGFYSLIFYQLPTLALSCPIIRCLRQANRTHSHIFTLLSPNLCLHTCHSLASIALYFNRCLQRRKPTVFSSLFLQSPSYLYDFDFLDIPQACLPWKSPRNGFLNSCTVHTTCSHRVFGDYSLGGLYLIFPCS